MATPVVVDLCDSDDDINDNNSNLAVAVARLPPPRRRRQQSSRPYPPNRNTQVFNVDSDDDNGEVEVLQKTPSNNNQRGQKRPHADNSSSERKVSFDEVRLVAPKPSVAQTPLEKVLEVFPDASLEHVKKLLKDHSNVHADVMNALLENSYPKEPKMKPTGSASYADKGGKSSYDFMSTSSFEPSKEYIDQSSSQLAHDFPFLTKAGAKACLAQVRNHYAMAHDKIVRAISGKDDGGKAHAAMGTGAENDPEVIQLRKYNAITQNKDPINAEQTARLHKLFNCNNLSRKGNFSTQRRRSSFLISDPILIEEVAFVQEKLREWIDGIELNIHRKLQRDIAVKEGSAVTCSCCYDEVSFDEMICCREAHLFCQGCLSNYVESQVFSNGSFGLKPNTKEPALELLCFHGEGCASGFDRMFLVKALKTKVLQRYDELQSQVTLRQAGLDESICTCPKCGFTAELPETQNIFLCESCRFESCRHCREESHIPLRCDEVEKKHEAEGRARVEEAASNAVIRFCPKCKKGIVKSDGCNKMTCACGIKFCYMCRAIVKDYTHFCQTPHCTHAKDKCNKCPLWTNDLDAIHEKAMREAAQAEAARVEAESTKAQASQETKVAGLFTRDDDRKPAAVDKVRIDVDAILQAPKRPRAR